MEEIININGIDYIKKDRIKDMELELANLKKIMKEINQLTTGETDGVITNRIRVNISDNDIFKVPPKSQELWEIRMMNENGEFFAKNNRKFRVTIKEVFIAQKEFTQTTTVKEARELRKQLNLNEHTFNRLIYNIQQGNFTKFIKEWNKRTQPVVGKKQVPVENNSEKRRESGIYV